ncbi:MAG: hypothetical protein VXW92_02395 [Actinomycetota bacterium]|nr:hypothetical protein [Actinomycetota bacterium]
MALAPAHGAVTAAMTGTDITVEVTIQPRCGHVRALIDVHRPRRDEVP